jgi:hypothetical protein
MALRTCRQTAHQVNLRRIREPEMNSQTLIRTCTVLVATIGIYAHAETVTPTQGQTPDQIQADTAACQTQAKSAYDQALASANQTAATSTAPPPQPSGGRLRGAAVGAAAGSVSAEMDTNDREDARVGGNAQEEYKENEAQEAAAKGAAIGGVKQRQSRRQQAEAQEQQAQQQSASATQSADSASKQAYSTCMSSKGYAVTP